MASGKVGLVIRMLVVTGVTIFVLAVAEIMLIGKFNRAPFGGREIIVVAILVMMISYLYWRPRYTVN